MTSTATLLKRVPAWLRDWAPYLVLAVPILLCACYAFTFGVNVFWGDQCEGMLPLLQKWDAGTLSFADFWAQHNEHRHVIPRMIMFALALATRWNIFAELALIQVIVISMLLMVLAVFRRQCVSTQQLWLMLPLALVGTSLRQCENFVFGWQIGFMLTAAAATGAFLCLHLMDNPRRLKLKLAGAIAAATVASYSAAFGLLVWPAGLGPLLLLPLSKRRKLTLAGIWLALGVAEVRLYFWGYIKPPQHPDIAFSWEYFATIVGGAILPMQALATVGGVVFLALTAISVFLALKHGKGSRCSFWLAAIAFGLLTQVMTTLGRSGFGAGQALSPRYATCSLFVVIGVYAILSDLCIDKVSRPLSAMWGSLMTLMMIGVALSAWDGYQEGAVFRSTQQYDAYVYCTSQSQPDKAIPMAKSVSPAEMRRGIDFLRQHHLNLFASDALSSRYAPPDASLPTLPVRAHVTLNEFAMNKDTGLINFDGWAIDDKSKDVVGGLYLEIDGVSYPAYYGLDRSDVATELKNDEIRWCGFQRQFSPQQLGVGRHHIVIKVLTKDRTAFYAPTGMPEPTARK